MSWTNSVSKANDQHNYSECPLITDIAFTSLFSIRLFSFKEWIFFSHCAVSLNVSSLKLNVVKSTSTEKRNSNSNISNDALHTLEFERKQHKKFIPKWTMENALSCCTVQAKRQRINTRENVITFTLLSSLSDYQQSISSTVTLSSSSSSSISINKHNNRTEIVNREFQFPQITFYKLVVISPQFILCRSFVWKIDAYLIS